MRRSLRRTGLLIALSLLTVAAAAMAALRVSWTGHSATSSVVAPAPAPPAVFTSSPDGPLKITAQLARRWLDPHGSAQYLEVDVFAEGSADLQPKTAVNAVLIVDRSGSMAGEKIERARDAARALIVALDGEDRLSIVDFASDANVLLPSAAMTPGEKERALALVAGLAPTTSTNLGAAIELAAPQLLAGHSSSRVDKVFLASDGQVNTGVVHPTELLQLVASRLEGATISTFGIGADYDEDLMTALAVQSGGRGRFIENASELPLAIKIDLSKTMGAVARDVHLSVQGLAGVSAEKVIGFATLPDGSVRLGDFFAGERRRVLIKLALPGGTGETKLAQISLSCADVHGAKFQVQTEVGGEYTADARLLQSEPNETALFGAQADMADHVREAVTAQGRGDGQAVARAQQWIRGVAADLAHDKPAAAPMAAASARSWEGMLDATKSGSPVARKKSMQAASEDSIDISF